MTLTQPQQRKVEQNLGLVGKVIKDKVHNPGQNSIYSYDDLSDRLHWPLQGGIQR